MRNKPTVQVCLTPALVQTYDFKGKVAVVIDILRATTSMCVAIDHGAAEIIPVLTPEECAGYQSKGFLCAAERNGSTVDGFTMGNSPFSYMKPEIKGARIAMTTTNGTQAIQMAKNAFQIVIGSFANLTILSEYILDRNEPIILLCSGWKNRVNLEDTIFAGALVDRLGNAYNRLDDASVMAHCLFEAANHNKRTYIELSHHYQRLIEMNLQKDVKYCLRQDSHPVLPILENGSIVNASSLIPEHVRLNTKQ